MKTLKLIVISVAAVFAWRGSPRRGLPAFGPYCTTNEGEAPEQPSEVEELRQQLRESSERIEALLAEKVGAPAPGEEPSELASLKQTLAEQGAMIEALQAQAAPSAPEDALNLGGLQLPAGLDRKDVSWRVKAGLALKQAVLAALHQQRHNENKKALAATTAAETTTAGAS